MPVPMEFVLFALTLLGVALFHRHTLGVALAGLASVVAWKIAFTGFDTGPGLAGFVAHFAHEWVKLSNLLGLLLGFALIARHFEKSHLPALLPRYLAPYIYQVALSNRRLIRCVDTGDMATSRITFSYRSSDDGQLKRCTLAAEAFHPTLPPTHPAAPFCEGSLLWFLRPHPTPQTQGSAETTCQPYPS